MWAGPKGRRVTGGEALLGTPSPFRRHFDRIDNPFIYRPKKIPQISHIHSRTLFYKSELSICISVYGPL